MKNISASAFKANCLSLLNEVAQNHEALIVTKHGKPVAKIIPIDNEKDVDKNPLKGSVISYGDI